MGDLHPTTTGWEDLHPTLHNDWVGGSTPHMHNDWVGDLHPTTTGWVIYTSQRLGGRIYTPHAQRLGGGSTPNNDWVGDLHPTTTGWGDLHHRTTGCCRQTWSAQGCLRGGIGGDRDLRRWGKGGPHHLTLHCHYQNDCVFRWVAA